MNNNNIILSYILCTRNRISYLKITLQKLIEQLQPDEEIIVVDGNSTDGTNEYLQLLFNQKRIHQLLSEPDKNQAHGWNKALLMAKGKIIKKIIDDDVFCYAAIRICKNHMQQNPGIDVIISNDAGSKLNNYQQIEKYSRLPEFEKCRNKLIPSFTFGDVHMLIRRSALAYIGLYNTGYINMDWEYSLRISHLQANIAYYTGYNALSVAHPQTITYLRDQEEIKQEGKKGKVMYDYAGDAASISNWSKVKIAIGKFIYSNRQPKNKAHELDNLANLDNIYAHYYEYIQELNNDIGFKFIT